MRAAFVLLALAAAAPPPRPAPIAAHNCYPADGRGRARLDEALALGFDNIEIDVGWDAERRRLIVGHDEAPKAGATYPEFEEYLVPALEARWRTPRPDGAPTVLTIDWKTDHPDAVARFRRFLDDHADWFSSAPKAEPSPLTVRRLTVCLTGSDRAKERYDASIPPGGTYRAFRDVVFGAGGFRDAVASYAPAPATAFHRFVTIAWGHVERGGPAAAGDWSKADEARLKAIVDHAHDRGYRVRFYCLNERRSGPFDPYGFPNPAAALIRWKAAAAAGADWVASDDYAAIARALVPDPSSVTPRPPATGRPAGR